MGVRGPVPKRSASRKRRNKPANEVREVRARGVAGLSAFKIPAERREWHPIAKAMWRAVKRSGQVRFYEPSDWMFLYSLMDDLTYVKTCKKRPAQMLETVYSCLARLLVAEGDRRRLQIELSRPDQEDSEADNLVVLQEWAKKLSG